MNLRPLLSLAWVAGLAVPCQAWDLEGSVRLVDRKGREVSDRAARAEVVVFFDPVSRGEKTKPSKYEITTRDKEFVPRLLVAGVGSVVRFPNEDDLLHNVFSLSEGNEFDVGLYGEGPGPSTTLRSAGLVRVFCNVHHDMVAYVWALDTPHHTGLDPQGRFRLSGLPDGDGVLTVWHERAEPKTVSMTAGDAAGGVEIDLELSKPEIPKHRDKNGRRYEKRDY